MRAENCPVCGIAIVISERMAEERRREGYTYACVPCSRKDKRGICS